MPVLTPRLPRHLHPGAWWLWALGLAAAASRTTNPYLLALIIAVTGFVVAARRTEAPWARSYGAFLRLALVVIAIRVFFLVLFGVPHPGTVLVTLPSVQLPEWVDGVTIGGEITVEGVTSALYGALRLATVLVCVGAANALANPRRLLRSVPGALYEVGVAVVVAMTFAPQAITHVARVRAARRLRGHAHRGVRGLRGLAIPVLEGALEHSLELAAAMDARGYGRSAPRSALVRRATAACTLGGLLGVCAGLYGLLGAGGPPLLGMPLLVLGCASAVAGLALGGKRSARSRYRPDPWAAPEWAVTCSGALAAAALFGTALSGVSGLHPPPGTLPPLPLVAAGSVVLALLPAWVAPSPRSLT